MHNTHPTTHTHRGNAPILAKRRRPNTSATCRGQTDLVGGYTSADTQLCGHTGGACQCHAPAHATAIQPPQPPCATNWTCQPPPAGVRHTMQACCTCWHQQRAMDTRPWTGRQAAPPTLTDRTRSCCMGAARLLLPLLLRVLDAPHEVQLPRTMLAGRQPASWHPTQPS